MKLVVPRAQIFHDASFRPASRHRIRLGADRGGKMVAAIHEVDAQTSRHDLFPGEYTATSARLHGFANFRGHERLVRTDVQTPGYMRAPFEHPACFAMESCVDELAYALGPGSGRAAARQRHRDRPGDQASLSPRAMSRECLRRGAELFGWSKRTHGAAIDARDGRHPRSAGASRSAPIRGIIVPTIAQSRRSPTTASVRISIGGHEMGQGIRTALANAVGRKLGVPAERYGRDRRHARRAAAPDRRLLGHGIGRSRRRGCRRRDAEGAVASWRPDGHRRIARRPRSCKAAGRPSLEVEVQRKAPGPARRRSSAACAPACPRSAARSIADYVTFSFIAHFVEVRVEPSPRRIRVPRVVSVADCGRVMSPRTAASQVRGGVVWGIGATLREASEVDPRYGGFLNADLAEYVVPVNADIGSIEVDFIDKPDLTFNSAGVKGLGEVSMTGVAPAIANAVFHATGRRLRELPIRIEHLL